MDNFLNGVIGFATGVNSVAGATVRACMGLNFKNPPGGTLLCNEGAEGSARPARGGEEASLEMVGKASR